MTGETSLSGRIRLPAVRGSSATLVTYSLHGKALAEFKKYWDGYEHHQIVDWDADYVVFFDAKGEIDWDTSAKHDQKIKANAKGLAAQNTILAEAALLEANNCDALGREVTEWFRYLIGKALVFNFAADYASAQKMLVAAGQFYRARSEEKSRWWYLTASIIFTAPTLVMGLLLWSLRGSAAAFLGPVVFLLALCFVAGASGALLSVIARSGRLNFDSSAGWQLHYLEAASRILMGALSGTVVGLAVKSNLFLQPLTQGKGVGNAVIILAAFAAGASERMLGSIISKFDPSAPPAKSTPPHSSR